MGLFRTLQDRPGAFPMIFKRTTGKRQYWGISSRLALETAGKANSRGVCDVSVAPVSYRGRGSDGAFCKASMSCVRHA